MKHSTLTTVAIVAALVVPFISVSAATTGPLAITGFEQVTLDAKALPRVVVDRTAVTPAQTAPSQTTGVLSTPAVLSLATSSASCGISTYNTYGSRSADVVRVQHFLNVQMNAGLPETGFYGVRTTAAVKMFQTRVGLPATGNQLARTTAQMNLYLCGSMSFTPGFATRGSRGAHVVTIQTILNSQGAQLPVTGYYGALTEAAVRTFQTNNGIPATGSVFSRTLEALTAQNMFDTSAPALLKEGGVRRLPSISVSKTRVTPLGEVAGGVTVDSTGTKMGLADDVAHKDAGVLLTILLLCVAFLLFVYRKDKAALMMLLVLAFGLQYATAQTRDGVPRLLAMTGFDQIRLESLYLPRVASSNVGVGGSPENVECDAACMQVVAARAARAERGYAAYGDYGANVKRIQVLLNAHAAETKILLRKTGYFGPATRAAVLAFQKQHAIAQTGNVYAKTLAALTGTTSAPTVAVTSTTVTPTAEAAPKQDVVKESTPTTPKDENSATANVTATSEPEPATSTTGQTVALIASILALAYFAQQHYKSKQSIV